MFVATGAGLAAAALAAGACDVSPPVAEAKAGLEIVYERDGAVLSGTEVLSAERHVSRAAQISFPAEGGAPFRSAFAETKIWGVIPVSLDVESAEHPELNFSKSRVFDADPVAALAGMTPGETRTIASRETFRERGLTFTEAAPISATFLGCTTEDVAGAPERVLNYRFAIPTLIGDMEGKRAPALTTSVYTWSISERLGWQVKMEGGGAVVRAKSVKEGR